MMMPYCSASAVKPQSVNQSINYLQEFVPDIDIASFIRIH